MQAAISRLNRYNKEQVMKYIKMRQKVKKDLVSYLETECHFRDYRVLPSHLYGRVNRQGVHVNIYDLGFNYHYEIDDAIDTFCRDGYSTIYIYI